MLSALKRCTSTLKSSVDWEHTGPTSVQLMLLRHSSFRKRNTVVQSVSEPNQETSESFKKSYKVGRHLNVYETSSNKFAPETRPLTIMYSWLNAKKSHVDKYCSIYQREGIDVVQVYTTPRKLFFGKDISQAVEEVLTYITEPKHRKRPLLVHGFSVGGLVFCETVAALRSQRHANKSADVKYRIKGTIMDSIVDYEDAPRGISRAITDKPLLQNMLKTTIELQLKFIFPGVTKRFRVASSVFHENPFRFPTMMLNSHQDQIGSLERMQKATAKWREKGIPVVDQWWSDSFHAAHLREHPLEYADLVTNFLLLIGLLDEQFIPLKQQFNSTKATEKQAKIQAVTPAVPAYFGA